MKSVTFDNSRGFALGFDEAAPSPFVTWQFTETENGQKDYYWGHYHSSGQTAEKDFASPAPMPELAPVISTVFMI